MKEQEATLTIQAQTPYAGYGGIFMVNGGESAEAQQSFSAESVKKQDAAKKEKEARNQGEQEHIADKRREQDLQRIQARQIREPLQALDRRIVRHPLQTWTKEDLKVIYEDLVKLTKEDTKIAKNLKGWGNESFIHRYRQLIEEELERREEDVNKLREEAFGRYAPEVKNVGAATLTADPFADVPSLGAIVTEINTETARLEGRPRPEDRQLEPDYLENQRERVQRVIDSGTLTPAQITRAHELVNTLNKRLEQETERVQNVEQRRRQAQDAQREQQMRDQGHLRKEIIKDRYGNDLEIDRPLGLSHERMIVDEEKFLMRAAIDEIYDSVHGVPVGLVEHEALDELFNRMFEYADQGLREEFRHAFGIGEREKDLFKQELSNMIDEYAKNLQRAPDAHIREMWRAKADIVIKFIEKYDVEFTTRELLHNAFYIAETEREFEDFAKFVKNFQSGFADQAFLNAPEVETAFRIREQVLYELKREHGGYLPPELVTYSTGKGETEWERRTKEAMDKLNEKGFFSPTNQHVKEWRIRRALSLSRGLGMVMLRFPEISAEGVLPAPSNDNQAIVSIPWEKLAWDLNPLDHKIKRYNMGRENKAIFYAAKNRTKKGLLHLWNQDELKLSMAQDAITVLGTTGEAARIADQRNIFRTGGPFTHTGWRPYDAALKPDRTGLQEGLKQSPGLAMSMIFNRYETSGLGQKRYEFYLAHKDEDGWTPEKGLEAWEKEAARLRKTDEYKNTEKERNVAWKRDEKESWKKSANRIPHVILRIIMDENNVLLKKPQINALRKLIESREGVDVSMASGEFTKIEQALELAKEHLMKRRREAIAGGSMLTDAEDRLIDRDFAQIDDLVLRGKAERLRDIVVGRLDETLLERIFQNVNNRMFPYAVTAQDVPWSEFKFEQTGARGFFTRKVNDALSVAEADAEMEFLVKHLHEFKSPEEVVEQLKKIFYKAEIYDYERAQDAIKDLTIGIIRYFEKDGILKMPILGEIMGPINALRGRGESFAQSIGGAHSMSWDSDDIYNFTEQLRQIFKGSHENEGRGIIAAIRKETGGTLFQALGKKTKIALYLLMLFLSYEMINKLISEKA